MAPKKPSKAERDAAAKAAAREEAAANAFTEADEDGSGEVDAKELEVLLKMALEEVLEQVEVEV